MNTILYLFRASYTWRMIPQDLFPWKNMSCYFIRWKNEDFIESLVGKLRSNIRVSSRQEASDTGIIDFRNVRTSFHANANSNLNENKRSWKQYHIINNQRDLGSIAVRPAKIYERSEAAKIIENRSYKFPYFVNIFSDGSYRENVTNRDLDRSNGNLKSCLNPMHIHPNSLSFSNDGL